MAGQGAESSGCAWGGVRSAWSARRARRGRGGRALGQHGTSVTSLEEGVAPLHQDEQQVCLSAQRRCWESAALEAARSYEHPRQLVGAYSGPRGLFLGVRSCLDEPPGST